MIKYTDMFYTISKRIAKTVIRKLIKNIHTNCKTETFTK